jgi:hypothetical protein
MLILTGSEHRRLVELALRTLTIDSIDDETHLFIRKLVHPRQIQDIGIGDAHHDDDDNDKACQVPPQTQSGCPRCGCPVGSRFIRR